MLIDSLLMYNIRCPERLFLILTKHTDCIVCVDSNLFYFKFILFKKSLLHQGLSEPEFYGDVVYKLKKIRGMTDFSDQFRKNIMRYKRIGYQPNVMQQSACLVINPITVAWSTGAQLIIFFCFRFSVLFFDRPGISIRHAAHCICRVLVFAFS